MVDRLIEKWSNHRVWQGSLILCTVTYLLFLIVTTIILTDFELILRDKNFEEKIYRLHEILNYSQLFLWLLCTGDILAIEKSYASSLSEEHRYSNCATCFLRCDALIHCPTCSLVGIGDIFWIFYTNFGVQVRVSYKNTVLFQLCILKIIISPIISNRLELKPKIQQCEVG